MDVTMEDPTNSEFEAVQVKVAFTTTDEDIQLPETKRQLLVPAGELLARSHRDHLLTMAYRHPKIWPVAHSQLRVHARHPKSHPVRLSDQRNALEVNA